VGFLEKYEVTVRSIIKFLILKSKLGSEAIRNRGLRAALSRNKSAHWTTVSSVKAAQLLGSIAMRVDVAGTLILRWRIALNQQNRCSGSGTRLKNAEWIYHSIIAMVSAKTGIR